MKKIIAILLVLVTLLSLVSCGADYNDGKYIVEVHNDITESYKQEIAVDDIIIGSDGISPEDYGKFLENPFISTTKENISTFAADVDTASYSFFRRLVSEGYSLKELIATAGKNVRTEEMVNYFDYGYQNPKDGELFSTQMQIAPCPWNSDAKLLILGLQAKEIETAASNNLVFLVDVSGSMGSDDRLGLLKKSFAHLVGKLGEDDTISIVTYSGSERVVLEGCNGAKKDMIMQAINSLSSGGSTNGEAGLTKAYEIAEKYRIKGGNNRIIMASDGDLNVGISSVEELKNYVTLKKESGTFLSVLGFGYGNYKDSNMEAIADCGNGVYYYIDGEAEAEKVFGTDLFGTLYTVAKDVKLQLTFNPTSVSSYRLVGYENRLLSTEDFIDDTKDAGELGAGHSLTVCYEIMLTEEAFKEDSPVADSIMPNSIWATLGVRYKEPDGMKSNEQNYSFGKENYTEIPDENFKFICAVVETSMLLHKSDYAKDITIDDILVELNGIDLNDDYKQQFKTLIEKLATNK